MVIFVITCSLSGQHVREAKTAAETSLLKTTKDVGQLTNDYEQ